MNARGFSAYFQAVDIFSACKTARPGCGGDDPEPGRDLVSRWRDRVRNPRVVMAVYTL
ncbi:hypothetical protein [Sorangium sp. So ce1151]|uniref:hypothetical protein n=1 Tax=Sorangium sp. So ce1151 TaxID=3133332 RepID=UPI003F5FF5C5